MKTTTRATTPRKPARRTKHIAAKWAWHYRTLLALRDHLLGGNGDRVRESIDPMEPPSLHAADFADEVYDRELARALPPNRADAWREITDAIDRIKRGTYGRGEAAGRRIPARQLRAMPWRRDPEKRAAAKA
jgi:RNA polymerase-binding transcription factor DksA